VLRDPSLGGDFDGRYLFSYFCAGASSIDSGRIYTAALDAPAATARDEGLVAKIAGAATGFGLGSFGLDGCGHPYAMNVTAGGLWRIEGDTPGACGEFIAPQTTLGPEAPSGVVKSSDAVFPYTSSVRGSTFSCTLDGAPTGCGALTARGAGGSASVSGLADGPHTFTVAATDEAGNAGPAAARTWTVDAAPPQTTITDGPPARTRLRTLTYTFSSNEAGSTFTCSLDHAPSTACSSPMTYSDVPDGTHTLLVTATDRGGAVDPTPAERIVVVDSAAPDTFVSSRPQARTNATRATVAFGATESGSTTCSVDGARPAPCSTPVTVGRLRPGRHTFSVFATDLAGNVDESPASVEWTVEPLALPALRVRARADGRAVLALGPLAQDALGTAVLHRGARRLSAIRGFRAAAGRPPTVELRLTRLARRMVARHRRLVVRVTITFDVGASLTKTLVVLAPRARRDSAPT